MTTFLLLPGAGGDPAYWDALAPELARLGHLPVPVDLPQHDEGYGWADLTDVAVAALHRAAAPAARGDLVVVAQSMGAYVGPLVCERETVRLLVLLNPMIPAPGESGADWWRATDHAARRAATGLGPFDPVDDFLHDVPEAVAAVVRRSDREPSERSFAEPWPATAWPQVPTVVLQGSDDRLFPVPFQRAVARERLGADVETLPGGHLVALSRPVELAARLDALAV
ncbi:alpha/beta fold hydrolase [Cellulosimicrobium protaetiae]|uniref:Alpha/beta hydrolase n=1 Tax=Cellulosimicrobium protaetiae TaxID=2587808 RepID=A0A6M5UGM0_9MICO|nr:alpha/beta hydrolase [Cellulosimicrobium protaetiae]QJW36441.1 alpha/beta hydrolase [Cellulosimicrobium protaetiae]